MLISAFQSLLAGSIDHEDWNTNFSEPGNVGDISASSLEVLNGRLDSENLLSAQKVTNEMIRPQSLCGGQMVGQTSNQDYPDLVFGTEEDIHGAFKPIPGACTDFYLPYDCSVLVVQWYFSQTNTVTNHELSGIADTGQQARVSCFIDDIKQDGATRGFPKGLGGSSIHMNTMDRCYSLHVTKMDLIGTTAFLKRGWHTASLRLYMNENFLRVRSRNVKVIWFK